MGLSLSTAQTRFGSTALGVGVHSEGDWWGWENQKLRPTFASLCYVKPCLKIKKIKTEVSYYIYLLYCLCVLTCVELRGQYVGVDSFCVPYEF